MTTTDTYQAAARAYTDGVRALFTPPAGAVTRAVLERGERAALTPLDLAAQAEKLVPLAADFTQAAAAQLAAPDPDVRTDTAARLLTKALTDLQIRAQLLEAALDEEAGIGATRGIEAERSVGLSAPADLEENLRFLLGRPEIAPAMRERSITALPADVPAARAQLTQVAGDTLALIGERAGKTGQAAISGLAVLGLGDVAKAASVVGLQIADALGATEKVTHLYALCRQFALSAYDSLVALLGPTVAQTVSQQVLAWVNDVVQGEEFARLLEKLYQTADAARELERAITASQADLAQFVVTLQDVDALGGKFEHQIGAIAKLIRGLQLFSALPASVVPQGKLLMAAAYIVIGGYVVLAGADFVDAPSLRWLNRTPGVQQVVAARLAGA